MDDMWQEFLTIVREEVGSRVVDTWLKAFSISQWDQHAHTIYLKAPNNFVREWVERHYTALLRKHLGRLLNVVEPRIVFCDNNSSKKNHDAAMQPLMVMPARVTGTKLRSTRKPGEKGIADQINKEYTFDTFVAGPSNSLAYAAAQAVAEFPGAVYNPLFIYGQSGLGKTHLLHAIGNEIRKRNTNVEVLYQTTDRFVSDFINAIRFDKVHLFQKKYQSIDIFLVDDVQFICNKEQTQEAFFHIFNALHNAHKQIVFSSDTFPQNMRGVADRLRSRLGWGLVTDIQVPLLETRIAILKKKVLLHNIQVSDDVLCYLASWDVANIRELEGMFLRVIAHAALTQEPITQALIDRTLHQGIQGSSKRGICYNRILEEVGKNYAYTPKELCSKIRNKELVQVRHIAMFLIKKLSDCSLREIGKLFGGRDHSTIVHALEKVTEQIIHDEELQKSVKKIESLLTKTSF